MGVTPSTKKLKEVCAALGNQYRLRQIDLENVIYRDLGNGYDFEISGLDNKCRTFCANLYIRQTANPEVVIDRVMDIPSLTALQAVLAEKLNQYNTH